MRRGCGRRWLCVGRIRRVLVVRVVGSCGCGSQRIGGRSWGGFSWPECGIVGAVVVLLEVHLWGGVGVEVGDGLSALDAVFHFEDADAGGGGA